MHRPRQPGPGRSPRRCVPGRPRRLPPGGPARRHRADRRRAASRCWSSTWTRAQHLSVQVHPSAAVVDRLPGAHAEDRVLGRRLRRARGRAHAGGGRGHLVRRSSRRPSAPRPWSRSCGGSRPGWATSTTSRPACSTPWARGSSSPSRRPRPTRRTGSTTGRRSTTAPPASCTASRPCSACGRSGRSTSLLLRRRPAKGCWSTPPHYRISRTCASSAGTSDVPARRAPRVLVVVTGALSAPGLRRPLGPGGVAVLPAAWAGRLDVAPDTTWLDVDLV